MGGSRRCCRVCTGAHSVPNYFFWIQLNQTVGLVHFTHGDTLTRDFPSSCDLPNVSLIEFRCAWIKTLIVKFIHFKPYIHVSWNDKKQHIRTFRTNDCISPLQINDIKL
jgi:hypothetical protein